MDQPNFKDEKDYGCDTWVGHPCDQAVEKFEGKAPWFFFHYHNLWLVIIIMTSTNAVLGLTPFLHWIPIIVAIGAALHSVLNDQRLEERLTATNSAITKLNMSLNWWYSLTLVQRRMEKNFEVLVTSCEAVAYHDFVWRPRSSSEAAGERMSRASRAVPTSKAEDKHGKKEDTMKGPNQGHSVTGKSETPQPPAARSITGKSPTLACGPGILKSTGSGAWARIAFRTICRASDTCNS